MNAVNVIYILSYQLKLTAARLKKGTAQRFGLANLVRIFFNLSWYDSRCCNMCILCIDMICIINIMCIVW